MKILFMLLLLTSGVSAQSWKSLHLISGCSIFSITGASVKNFPGQMCLFLEDGSFISADYKGIRRISSLSAKLWEIPGHYHHQINLTYDKKKILALSSTLAGSRRQDKFQVISLEGQILNENSADKLSELGGLPRMVLPHSKLALEGKIVEEEISHFNSFHEIPALLPKKRYPPWMKPGHFILNGLEQGILVVSPDLKEVLFSSWFKNSILHKVHDVQVTSRGTFLYYNNLLNLGKPVESYLGGGAQMETRASGIFELDPLSKKVISSFIGQPPGIFYSWISGNVQELDSDTWLFTHFLTGTYIYSKSEKKILTNIVTTHATFSTYNPVQQVTAEDSSKFLQHWK